MVDKHNDEDMVHRLQTYSCQYCGYYHIGRRLKRDVEDCRKRWQHTVEKRRRRALWDEQVQPLSAFELWKVNALHGYDE